MSGGNALTSSLAKAATKATQALGDEVRESIQLLREKSPAYVDEAEKIAAKAASYLEEGIAGRMDPDLAREAAYRETGALELLAATAKEEVAQELMKRTKKAIDIVTDFGLQAVSIALKMGVKTVIGGIPIP